MYYPSLYVSNHLITFSIIHDFPQSVSLCIKSKRVNQKFIGRPFYRKKQANYSATYGNKAI